jgi:hypothetical protein
MLSPKTEDATGYHQSNHHREKHKTFHTFWPIPSAFHLTMCSEGHKTSATKTDAARFSKTSATSYQTTRCLFIYGLFNDAFNSSLYMALNNRMISK